MSSLTLEPQNGVNETRPAITRKMVVDAARSWIGVPYRHEQRRKDRKDGGVDCGGLVLCVCRDVGYGWVEAAGYGCPPPPAYMKAMCDANFQRVTACKPGDIILLRLRGQTIHLGIVADGGSGSDGLSFIHTHISAKVVKEQTMDAWWKTQIAQAYCLRGIAD
jgi:cell wall-associated NlpC family hydrolase